MKTATFMSVLAIAAVAASSVLRRPRSQDNGQLQRLGTNGRKKHDALHF
jgi:hypothetical protein